MTNETFKVAEDGTIIRNQETLTCPKCKKIISAEAKFCPDCGKKILNKEQEANKKSDIMLLVFIGIFGLSVTFPFFFLDQLVLVITGSTLLPAFVIKNKKMKIVAICAVVLLGVYWFFYLRYSYYDMIH